jgi:hypothetical protein
MVGGFITVVQSGVINVQSVLQLSQAHQAEAELSGAKSIALQSQADNGRDSKAQPETTPHTILSCLIAAACRCCYTMSRQLNVYNILKPNGIAVT